MARLLALCILTTAPKPLWLPLSEVSSALDTVREMERVARINISRVPADDNRDDRLRGGEIGRNHESIPAFREVPLPLLF